MTQAQQANTTPPQAQAFVGIDVSKKTLDAALSSLDNANVYKSVSGSFPNTKAGFTQLLKWAKRLAGELTLHFCLEATGSYSTPIAEFLVDAKQMVSVVNPFFVKHAALAQGSRNKTDKADAQLLANYCRKERPALWRMGAPEVRELTALVRHLDNLKELALQQQNRLTEAQGIHLVHTSLKALLKQTQTEIETIEKAIHVHINRHPKLKEDADLLQSIPGIGPLLTAHILAELPDVSHFGSAQSAAAYAGLNPQECRSGTSVRKRTRLSKRGNSHLRASLYMPAMAALRFNPSIKALAERMGSAGKVKMVIVGAAMRKLLMIAVGVLKSRTPFQENYQRRTLAQA